MKMGVRKPSIKKSIKARTTGKLKRSVKRSVNPLYGKKGMGVINDPKKAMYNKVYNKTTVSISDVGSFSSGNNKSSNIANKFFGILGMIFGILFLLVGIISLVFGGFIFIGLIFILPSLFIILLSRYCLNLAKIKKEVEE